MMKDNECVIGLDCGGTHTEGYVYDFQGSSLQRASSGSGNVVVDHDAAVKNIKSVIDQLLDYASQNELKISFIMLGIAGFSFIDNETKFVHDIGITDYSYKLVNDAELGLFSEVGSDDGCVVIAGTGSSVLSKNNNKIYRVGGWGHILGDEGGAYFIGKMAFKSVLNSYDLGIDNKFSVDLFKYLNINNVFEMTDYFYKANKTEIAAVAKFVFNQVDSKNNDMAQNIINLSANELAEQIKMSLEKSELLHDQKEIQIIFSGTPLEKNKNYRNLIINKLKIEQANIRLKKSDNNAFASYKYYVGTEKDNG